MLTGNVVNKQGVNECTKAVQWVLDTYMVKPNAKTTTESVIVPGSYLPDETILEKIFSSANDKKAEALWNGDNDGKSASEGDLALCNILAFWCGGDSGQMDRLFRSSSRIRSKWDEVHGVKTYGDMTIDKAIRNCKEFYKLLGKSVAVDDFNELVPILMELKPEVNPRYKHGDLGKGRLFADIFKYIARYVPERKKWYMPNITPHVCRHTYCSNMAKSGMNPKTLQYLMGHSDISVTMNVYTHIGFDDAEEELKRMEEFRKAQAEVEQKKEKPMSQKMFKVI